MQHVIVRGAAGAAALGAALLATSPASAHTAEAHTASPLSTLLGLGVVALITGVGYWLTNRERPPLTAAPDPLVDAVDATGPVVAPAVKRRLLATSDRAASRDGARWTDNGERTWEPRRGR